MTHTEWLDMLVEKELSTPIICERARQLLPVVTNIRGREPPACNGPDGQVMFEWNKGRHHLEAEIFEDRVEWFYWDREHSEDSTLGEDRLDLSVPAWAAKKLREMYHQ